MALRRRHAARSLDDANTRDGISHGLTASGSLLRQRGRTRTASFRQLLVCKERLRDNPASSARFTQIRRRCRNRSSPCPRIEVVPSREGPLSHCGVANTRVPKHPSTSVYNGCHAPRHSRPLSTAAYGAAAPAGAGDDLHSRCPPQLPRVRGDRSGRARVPKSWRSALRAANHPGSPCTPGPGAVDAEAR